MESIRLHTDLYSASAISRAIQLFESYASLTLRETDSYFEITVLSEHDAGEHRVAAELANHALALTVEESRA